jgi:hypothetical protein
MHILSADGITVKFDPAGGIVADLAIAFEGRRVIRPLHKAPWASTADRLPDHVPPIERKLAGDFFCAPFAVAEGGAPLHGWSANGDWEWIDRQGATRPDRTARYRLRNQIQGSVLTKCIAVHASHPFVYQVHTFEGGRGRIPIAHHAMLHVPGGAALSFSPKADGRTTLTPPETDPVRGRSALVYPQSFADLGSVRRADGSFADATLYPFEQRHEDVLVLTELPTTTIGWSAALAVKDGFVFIALKDAIKLPQTVLWLSNGGRYYEPWNGRHTNVLGIEEAAVGFHLPVNERASQRVATALELSADENISIRYAFGAIPVPERWSRISTVTLQGDTVVVTDVSGDLRSLPFDPAFFA